jgi:molybdopterin-guanine dinucleotide biosynthesis protein A
MGRPKPLTELGGRPLISYPGAAIEAAGLEPLVVAKPDSPLPPLRWPVLHEPAEPHHPLAGIIAALRASEGRPVVAVACDMPFIDPALLRALAALDAPLAVCGTRQRLQPFPGRYAGALAEVLEAALARRLPLVQAIAAPARRLDEAELARFGDPEWLCFSVNDEVDLATAERELRLRRAALS